MTFACDEVTWLFTFCGDGVSFSGDEVTFTVMMAWFSTFADDELTWLSTFSNHMLHS